MSSTYSAAIGELLKWAQGTSHAIPGEFGEGYVAAKNDILDILESCGIKLKNE